MDDNQRSTCVWSVCFMFILTALSGFGYLITWYGTSPSKPEYSIQQFYVPALDKTASNHTIHTNINFALEFQTRDTPVDYEVLNITLYYGPSGLSYSPIGSISLPGFSQEICSTVYQVKTIKTNGVPWDIAIEEVNSKGSVVFKVDISTVVNYRISCHGGGRQKIKMGGILKVSDLGINIEKHGTKLELLSTSVKLSRRQGPNEEELNLGRLADA